MHIFLTGGTGFFGRALLQRWARQQSTGPNAVEVTVLSRSPAAFCTSYPEFAELPWLHFKSGDICNSDSLQKNSAFTHVLHAAADSTLGPRMGAMQRYDQIVNGTRNMLDFAVRCKAQRFLFVSSGAVYGIQPPHLARISEEWHGMPDPMNSAHAYGIAKRTAEHLCALYSETFGLHTVIARCFAFVGPDLPLSAHFAVGNFIRDALWETNITVNGDGTPIRSFLDQRDLAYWLTELLVHGEFAQAYNVGSDQAISISDLAYLVRDALAPGKSVRLLRQPLSDGGRNLYVPNTQKARGYLGLGEGISLRDSVIATATAAKKLRPAA